MLRLSFLIILLISFISKAQSPHGDNFDKDCSVCHQTESWIVILEKVEFNHNTETDFQLIGQHQSVKCSSCHTSLVFEQAQKECQSCHKDIHQNTVGVDCARCHSPQTWKVVDINLLHQQTRFPLVGAHNSADCQNCHTRFNELIFEPLNVDCYSCHSKDYQMAKHPDHLAVGFSTNCIDCHNINTIKWTASNINHDFFPLTGGHNLPSCNSCHQQNTFQGLSRECYSCHRDDYEGTDDPNHISAGFPTDCTQCHNINDWDDADFNHNLTTFPLTGAHQNITCGNCHQNGYSNIPSSCISCHQITFNNTQNPNHTQIGISSTCENCHTTSGWLPSTFVHSNTAFPLTGRHNEITCQSCHSGNTAGTAKECFTCHQNNFNEAPNHIAQSFPKNCEMCHNTVSWDQTNFNHSNTSFPLTGAHIQTDCSSCHITGFTGTPNTCVSCHQVQYNLSSNPSHTSLGLSNQCQECHTTNPDWQPASFPIHNNFYVLEGAHSTIASNCNTCHNGNYNVTPNTCFGCHASEYNNTTNPSHISAGFPTDCQSCHSQSAWTPATFDHDARFFPIYSGAHNGKWSNCTDCHTTPNNFAIFSCIDCHEHNRTDTDNDHSEVNGYVYASANCYACHPNGSSIGSFNHSITNFPLTGSHSSLNCIACHSSGYVGTPIDCKSCHQDDFNGSANPNHVTLGLTNQCSDCHTTNPGWSPATFSVHNNYYQLLGAHSTIASNCNTCHNGNYNITPNSCVGCHQQDYTNAQNHSNQGFPTTCETCHSSIAWSPSIFNHQNTSFPLTGVHTTTTCISCHQSGFSNTPSSCISCHQDDFNGSINPNHITLGLPNQCSECHTTNPNWEPATFSIHNNYYPLVGAHSVIASNCNTCHNGDYNVTPNTCVGCHLQDYNSTTNPNHQSAGFPSDCLECHSQNSWVPSTFNHDQLYFPIYSGRHQGEWNTCTDCHTSPSNFSVFECINCHEHNRTDTDDDHSEVSGYIYQSTACLNCHPNGESDKILKKRMEDM